MSFVLNIQTLSTDTTHEYSSESFEEKELYELNEKFKTLGSVHLLEAKSFLFFAKTIAIVARESFDK